MGCYGLPSAHCGLCVNLPHLEKRKKELLIKAVLQQGFVFSISSWQEQEVVRSVRSTGNLWKMKMRALSVNVEWKLCGRAGGKYHFGKGNTANGGLRKAHSAKLLLVVLKWQDVSSWHEATWPQRSAHFTTEQKSCSNRNYMAMENFTSLFQVSAGLSFYQPVHFADRNESSMSFNRTQEEQQISTEKNPKPLINLMISAWGIQP